MDYFKTFKINADAFLEKESLLKVAHGIAFAVNAFLVRLEGIPEWVAPYLNQLRSDSIQIFPTLVFGTKRSLHLYERACIEDFLRYVYFFDHKIEHILLQTYPKRFESIDTMIDWLGDYPELGVRKKFVSDECGELASLYAELSRTVHGTTLADQQISQSLKDPIGQKINCKKEEKKLRRVFQSIFFLLSTFHIDQYRQLQLDERTLLCQYLSRDQIQALSGLRQ
jgi:hypothetical protein